MPGRAAFEFNFNLVSPRDLVSGVFCEVKGRFAPRCALAGDLLLSVATKVGKSAFYRRQRVVVRVDGCGG